MRDLSLRSPEYRHIQPGRVLVVAGEARRGSRGTVKPLTFAKGASRDGSGVRKPVVRLNGKRMLYCITLRPLFFRSSRPSQRVETLLHELFHVSPGFVDLSRQVADLGVPSQAISRVGAKLRTGRQRRRDCRDRHNRTQQNR